MSWRLLPKGGFLSGEGHLSSHPLDPRLLPVCARLRGDLGGDLRGDLRGEYASEAPNAPLRIPVSSPLLALLNYRQHSDNTTPTPRRIPPPPVRYVAPTKPRGAVNLGSVSFTGA